MKFVITGGPCSGKTTLIDKLKDQGFRVMDEVAREVLVRTPSIAFYDLEKEIYEIQVAKEKIMDWYDGPYFLDRGLLDVHAYFKHHTGKIPQKFSKIPVKNYEQIFVLDRLPLVNDGIRLEDEKTAAALHQSIIDSYVNAGYRPVIVPAISVDNRLELILSHTRQLVGGR